jgi:hypothetical protein
MISSGAGRLRLLLEPPFALKQESPPSLPDEIKGLSGSRNGTTASAEDSTDHRVSPKSGALKSRSSISDATSAEMVNDSFCWSSCVWNRGRFV